MEEFFARTKRFKKLSKREFQTLKRNDRELAAPAQHFIADGETRRLLQRIIRTIARHYNASEQEVLTYLAARPQMSREQRSTKRPILYHLFIFPMMARQPGFALTTWNYEPKKVSRALEAWARATLASLEAQPRRSVFTPREFEPIYGRMVAEAGDRVKLADSLILPNDMPKGTSKKDKASQESFLRRLGESDGCSIG